jgi:hypothetical protein
MQMRDEDLSRMPLQVRLLPQIEQNDVVDENARMPRMTRRAQ